MIFFWKRFAQIKNRCTFAPALKKSSHFFEVFDIKNKGTFSE